MSLLTPTFGFPVYSGVGRLGSYCISLRLARLSETLANDKFQPRLGQLNLAHADLMAYAVNLSSVIEVADGETIVMADPDDDIFLRCAVSAGAKIIVSGDHHLLELGQYFGIPILTVREFIEMTGGFSMNAGPSSTL